jgi:2-oxoisovalerate dehydrogenase E1 component
MPINTPSQYEDLYRALLLPRVIEEKMLRLIRQGRLSKWFSGYGQEAIAVGIAYTLKPEDYILPMHRNLGVWTTRGLPLERLFCQLMGKEGGYTRGRDRTFHFGLPEKNIVGMISQLAAMLPVADGLGLAAKLDGENRVAVAFTGEGATREGDFHEALNLASVWKLPVIFVVENNGYGLSTPTNAAVPVQDIASAGEGYAMHSVIVDGNDVLDVIRAVEEARERAVSGQGPTLLEMKTFRMRGHEEASGTKYVPQELMDKWAALDPLARFEAVAKKKLSLKKQAQIREELVERVGEVADWALLQPEVTSTWEREMGDVFAPVPAQQGDVPSFTENGTSTEMRFIDAISDALRSGMRADPKMMLMGQDIAEYGGVFKVTQDFVEEFGHDRVRNTPIIESGAIGAAMGLALAGHTPVVEIQYFDFISCGFNQIVNNLATTHYRWGAPLNVTIRAPFGGGIGAGPFHSQSMEAWFCHTPGLKVVIPSSPEDAKGLLLASLRDPNPVLFLEHKKLYRSLKGQVPSHDYTIELGKASVVREGKDITLVTYGIGVIWAQEEALYWQDKGIDIEIVDLRTLIPWDRETVIESVKKTNRVVVLHEAPKTGGFGAEISAQISESVFEHLEAPPVRLGGAEMPIPFSKQIEDEVYSAQSRLRHSLEALMAY